MRIKNERVCQEGDRVDHSLQEGAVCFLTKLRGVNDEADYRNGKKKANKIKSLPNETTYSKPIFLKMNHLGKRG